MHQLSQHSIGSAAASHGQLERPLIDVQKGQGAPCHLHTELCTPLRSPRDFGLQKVCNSDNIGHGLLGDLCMP